MADKETLADRLKRQEEDKDLPAHIREGRATLRKQQEAAEKTEQKVSLKERMAPIEAVEERADLAKKFGLSEAEINKFRKESGTEVGPGEFRPTVTGKQMDGASDAPRELSSNIEAATAGPSDTKAGKGGKAKKDQTPGSPKDETAAKPDPYANLGTELEDARKDYKSEKDNLSLREAIEAVANGIGKIGAGKFGQKTGTDMSGVKFDKQDWDKKRDHAQGDFRTSLDDVSTRRKEQIARDQSTTDGEYRNKVLAETKRHNIAVEKLSGSKVAAASESVMKKMSSKELTAFRKGTEETSNEIYGIGKDLEAQNVSEEDASERIQNLLQNKMGISAARAKEIVVSKSWFSKSMNDVSAIQSEVNVLAAQQIVVKQQQTQLQDGELLAIDKEGNPFAIMASEAEEFESKGYKVIQ